jgi:pSer/pThr/pTyr-binding forkhead associated (FHA) protein
MVKFMVFYEGKPLNTYVLDEPVITVGRLPENTISIANMGVSRRHIRIEEDFDRKYILTDLNSLNGTMVNGKRVKKVPLHSGDKITIGKFTIIYEEIASVTGAAVPEKSAASPVVAPPETPIEEADDKRSGTRTARKAAEEPPPPAEEEIPQGHTQKVRTAASEDVEEEKTPMLIDTAKHLTYILDKPYMTLGNGDSDDIPVSGFMVSDRQAFIEETAEGWRISTSKMLGKLKINGRQVKSHVLQHKDRVDLGSTSFRYMENG